MTQAQSSHPKSTFIIRRKSDNLPERYYQVSLISRYYVGKVKEGLIENMPPGCYLDETQVERDLNRLDEPQPVQETLFGEIAPPTGTELRDRALVAVMTSHTDWVDLAIREIKKIPSGLTFTTDDLWEKLPDPPEPRAMGAAIRRAAKDDIIVSTKRYQPSRRPACHARPILVWMRCV